MSKIWAIPPSMLDDSRLLREHQSLHKIMTQNTKKLAGKSTGRYYNYSGYIAWRHYLAVNEMRLRGMRHESFMDGLWKMIPESRKLILYIISVEEIREDVNKIRPRQHRATTASATRGRVPIPTKRLPLDLNEGVKLVAKKGLPKDVFLI